MIPNNADGMANSVDPDQTAPLGSALFAQTCLSENLGKLRYSISNALIHTFFPTCIILYQQQELSATCTYIHKTSQWKTRLRSDEGFLIVFCET